WRRNGLHAVSSPGLVARGHDRNGSGLRGIERHAGTGLLKAIQKRFEQLAHGRQGIVIKQRSHPLPQQAFAAQFCPDRLKQRTTELLGLVHQKCQHHQHGKHYGEMLLAMPIVVFKMIPLVFQRIERFVFDLPPGSSSPHEVKDVALAHAYVRYPTEVLDLGIADLPVLDEIDPHVDVRGIEWHLIDKPKAMEHPGSTVVSFIIGHASSLLCRLYLLEQKGMIAFFDPKDIVQIVMLQRLDVWSIGTQ